MLCKDELLADRFLKLAEYKWAVLNKTASTKQKKINKHF